MEVEKQVQQVETQDGISWYTETFGASHAAGKPDSEHEYIVLIPSGEGDCHNLTALAQLLASSSSTKGSYTVLTFDMPGFSRTSAPPEAYASVTPNLLARQILTLLDKLNISRATLFGCSSGGSTVLAITGSHPDRVKCGIVHEVPMSSPESFNEILTWPDDKLSAFCAQMFGSGFIEQDANDGRRKWESLGPEYHARLAKNYVTWARKFTPEGSKWASDIEGLSMEDLQKRPVFWTVGGLNPESNLDPEKGIWGKNFGIAKRAGTVVNRERLRCLHFPAVTIPNDTAEWILECVQSVKD